MKTFSIRTFVWWDEEIHVWDAGGRRLRTQNNVLVRVDGSRWHADERAILRLHWRRARMFHALPISAHAER